VDRDPLCYLDEGRVVEGIHLARLPARREKRESVFTRRTR
jgi:hypothetical protein